MTSRPARMNREKMHPAYRKIFRRIGPVILIMYLLAWLDRVNVGFASLTMNQDLGLTAASYGLGAALFFIGYFIFEVPSNVILQKVGARLWLARIMITWGLVTALTAFVVGEFSFYLARILLGIAEAGLFPGVLLYLTYWVPKAVRGRMTAIFLMAAPIASIVAGPVSSLVLVNMDGVWGLAGWQHLFLVCGILTFLFGFLVFRLLPSTPREAKWLTPDELRFLEGELERDRRESPEPEHGSVWAAFRSKPVLALALAYFGLNAGLYYLNFFLPQVLAAFKDGDAAQFDTIQIGFLSAIPWLITAVVMWLVARHSDRTQRRTHYVVIGALIAASALALLPLLNDNPVLTIVLLCITAAGSFTASPSFWQLPSQYLSTTTMAAGLAIINSCGNLAGFVAPYATGLLADATGSFEGGGLVAAFFYVVTAATAFLLYRRARRARRAPTSEEVAGARRVG